MSQYLGDISAYALAVSQGYTGTEEEYAELMASYATVGQTAVTAAQTATTKASEAATSATTATNKATEATTAATTATNKAAEAQADADAAALDASQAMSAASTATTKATEATTAAATAVSAKDDAVSANTAAQSAKTAAQTAQAGAETAAASVQSSAAQIQTNADDISELKEDLWNVSNDFARLDATFVRGEVNNPSATHRVMTESILSFSYPVFLKCVDDAFRFYVYLYDDNDSPTGLGWHLDYAYFSAGTKFRIVIAKRTEVAGPADINLYTSKILRQITPSFELEKVLSPYNKNIFTEHLYKHFEIKNYSTAAGKFINGGYQAIAVPMIYPFNVVITNINSTLYQFNVKTWNGNSAISTNYKGTSGWLDSAYTVPANTYFTIEYSRKVNTAPFPMVYEMPNIVSFSGVDMIPDLDVSDLLGDVDTLNFWNQSAASYSEYLKRYMAHDMDHKYYTNGTIIDAPKYYCHVAIHKLPVGVTVDFDDASFKVQFFNKDGDEGSEDITWSTDAKYIPKNTYFMISAQYSTAITLDEWYSKFNVVADCDIVNQNNDGFPIKNYGSQWNIPARFQLLWFSDIHSDQIRLKRIVDYMSANSDKISDAICTGDMVSDKVTDDFTFWSTCGANNILTIIGNHDGNTGSGWATNQTMYDKFFAPYIANWGVTYTANYCNWYKVYNNQVMLIGLCAVNSTAEEAAEMLNFLTTALNVAKTSSYAVVIAHHYPSDPTYTTAYKTPFESIGYNPVDLFIPESVFSAVETFKNGGGEFVCYITGHTHADLARYRTVENQIVLTVSTAFISAGIQQNAQFREFHTKYQDLFNILYVDTSNKIVSIKRIGSDRDVWFRKLDYLAINYQTGEMV